MKRVTYEVCTGCDEEPTKVKIVSTNLDGVVLDIAYLCDGCAKENDLTSNALRQLDRLAHDISPAARAIEQSAIEGKG